MSSNLLRCEIHKVLVLPLLLYDELHLEFPAGLEEHDEPLLSAITKLDLLEPDAKLGDDGGEVPARNQLERRLHRLEHFLFSPGSSRKLLPVFPGDQERQEEIFLPIK